MIGSSKSLSGFDPRTIPGCSLWLDAADTTTLTLSASNVTGWTDKSPLATPFTLSNGSGGSTIRTTYAGLSVVQVSNSCFFNASYSYPLATRSIFFVMAETVHSDWRGLLSFANTAGQSDYNTQNGYTITSTNTVGSNVQFSQNAGNGGFVFNYNASNGVKNVPFQLYEDVTSNTAVTLFIMGSNVYSSNTSVTPLTSTGLTVGGRGGIPNTGALVIAEVLLYSNVLTTSQRQQVEGYLAHKWGVSGYSPTTPLTIPGCQLWLDAADASTVTGTTSVTAWRDKSTNGYSANSFVNSVAYPSLVSNVQNGNSVIQYSAGNGSSIANFVLAQTMSIFMVYYPINQSTDGPFLEHGPDTNSTSGLYFHAQNGNNFSINSGSGQVAVNFGTTAVSNTWQMIEGINPDPANGNTMAYYVNGTTMASGGIQSGTTTLTKTLYINGRGGANNVSYNTYLAELIIFNIAVTTSQRQTIEGYLAKKWGITSMYLVLPSIHPFYSVRPHLRAFHPTDVPGCKIWFDAADQSSLTLSGTTVTRWANKSDSSSASTGSGTVSINQASLNGISSVRFPAGTNYLNVSSQTYTTSYRNIFFVVTVGASTSGYVYLISADVISGQYYSWTTGDIEINKTGTNGLVTNNPINFFNSTSIVSISTSSGGNTGIWVNGVSQTLAINSVGTGGFFSTGTSTTITLGGINGLTTGILDMYELLQYDGDLTTSQRQQIEGYLAHKWGLTLYLPVISPLSIAGCQMWLDGADPAGNGVIPANGATVSTWVDKSGNGYNATAAPSRTAGTYSTSFRAVYFPTSTTGYITNYTAAPTNETMFVVFNNPTASYDNNILIGGVQGARSLGAGYSGNGGQTVGVVGNLNTQIAWLARTNGGSYALGTTAIVTSQFTTSTNTISINGGTAASGGAPGFTSGRVTYLGVDLSLIHI